ncbi:MAG: tetratricopeptide repeat protein [Flavobacteriaceae bacterium]
MKKTILTYILLLSLSGISQEESNLMKEASDLTCSCIDKISPNEETTLEEQLKNCYMEGSLIYQLKGVMNSIKVNEAKDSTTTQNYEVNIAEGLHPDLEKYLTEHCDSYQKIIETTKTPFSQELLDNVSENACQCIGAINTSLVLFEKNQKIQECIVESLIQNHTNNTILSNVETLRKFLNEIQFYLTEHCEALKIVSFSSDAPKSNAYSSNQKAIDFYNRGIEATNSGNEKDAIKYYKKAVKIDPDFLFAWDNLGLSLRKMNNIEDAIEAYKESLRIDPVHPSALMNIGVAYSYLEDYPNAIKYYKILIKNYPEDPEGPYGISLIYSKMGDIENAAASIFDAYKLYKQANSPYLADAQRIIDALYSDFSKQDKTDIFKKIAKEKEVNLRFND